MKQYNSYTENDFTFVICTYKKCKYLEEAIQSLINQTKKANILISTSTPNDYVQNIARKHNIEVFINKDGGQIKDYNFALSIAKTELVMLMHQDEVLDKHFVEKVIYGLNHAKKPIIAFTDYKEMHNNKIDKKDSTMVKIKRLMLIPAKNKFLMSKKFGKRLIQRFGDPITHPTVVNVKKELPDPVFREQYKASMDWDLWERMSRQDGSFVYIDEVLLYHRMNEDNQTVKLLQTTNARYNDELEIFKRFWPSGIAKLLMKFYKKSDKYY